MIFGTADQEEAFKAALAASGISAVRGGRFLTLSIGNTKASRMPEIMDILKADGPVVALGDAPNDIAMLLAADIGVIVANPQHEALPPLEGEADGRIRRTSLPGPAGWNEAVLSIIETFTETGTEQVS